MPLRRRSEYSPLVRRLCQQGAYEWVPYDNDDFVKKILPCKGCQKAGRMTQNIAFKQGHAGEWVRVCRNAGCGLICYPAQPGTPPDLLQEIEAARAADTCSSTMATPNSHTSSAFFTTPSQDLNITPSVGGEFDDWLSPLFRDLDMELATDALLIQQLEEGPSPEVSTNVSARGREPTTLSSLTAVCIIVAGNYGNAAAADGGIAGRCPVFSIATASQEEMDTCQAVSLIDPGYQTPPPVKRKIYGLLPPAPNAKSHAKARSSAGNTKPAKSDKPRAEKHVKPSTKMSKADAASSALHCGDTRPPIVIVVSSDDECAPPIRRAEGADESDVIPPRTQPRTARSRPDPCSVLVRRALPTRPAEGAHESDVINITSSDSDSDSAPPATQPRTPSSRADPRGPRAPRITPTHRAEGAQSNVIPPRTQPRTARSRPDPRSALVRHAPPTRPAEGADESDVINITSSDSDSDSAPPATQPRTLSSPAIIRSRAPSHEVGARTRPTDSDSESNTAPPATQARTACSHAGVTLHEHQPPTCSLPAIVNELQEAVEAGSSNKENNAPNVAHSCLDFRRYVRLSARQPVARGRLGVFASLVQTSSSSSSFSSSSNSSPSELDDDEHHISDAPAGPVAEGQSSAESAGERIDATEAFGDPFRFEVYPAIPELATNINPDVEQRHWVLTVKIWYKNNMPPSTKMIALDYASCSVRLSDIFIVARTFRSTGITNFRLWNRFTTDWDMRSLSDYVAVSITDNHTLLIRLPTVATLASWAENVSQAYGLCQTVDPPPAPSRKGKELAYN
ncbi:hypothetical protein LXA43DRAFT_1062650 [Ganoderma leucocontextum]|nr:hypothetical protein LXA43DRAFT_1062650 [Ganoderma leucocontextum]